MSDRQDFMPELDLLFEETRGGLDAKILLARFHAQVSHPDFPKVSRILTDERTIDFLHFGPNDVRKYVAFIEENSAAYAGKKWAIVVKAARLTAFVMFFRNLLESTVSVQAFSTMEAAVDWLGLEGDARRFAEDYERQRRTNEANGEA